MLSSLEYGSFLAYTPRPDPENAVCHGVKQDAFWDAETRLIPFAVQRLKQQITPELEDLLASDVTLVPAPGSAPIRQKFSLWVPKRICEELVAVNPN